MSNEVQARLNALRQYLSTTDYKSIKASEGSPSIDWSEVKAKRQLCRDEINALESEMEQDAD